MTDRLKFSVPGKPEYVGMVRMAISSVANCAGFDVEEIEDIKVAVSEACTNVVCHCKDEVCECYEVACEVENDRIVIWVIDEAGGFDTGEYKAPVLDEPKGSGLGIFIIEALMDEVRIISELGMGTKIEMTKYFSR